MKKIALHWQIAIAIALAAVAGWLSGTDAGIAGVTFHGVYSFLGALFLRALKMIIVPLILSSIIVGIAGIGRGEDLGRLGGKTVGLYLSTGLIAVLVGLVAVNIIRPGIEDGEPVRDQLALEVSRQEVRQELGGHGLGGMVDMFIRMIPENVVATASNNSDLLALIFFAVLFGFFITRVSNEYAEPVYAFWNGVFQIMMRITEFIMKFAPIGVFGLVAKVVAETGFGGVRPLAVFAVTVVIALMTHALVIMPLIIRFLSGVNPWKVYRAASPALLTAFSTGSSSGTLPVTMDCVEKNVGVSNRVSSFVLPLGATINMNGTALYECTAVMFLAQAYGLELSLVTQFTIVITALVTSIGVAGVPSASMVAIGMILTAVGMPLEAMGVLFVFDRVLDMLRTSVNVLGDVAASVIVARSQGEELALK